MRDRHDAHGICVTAIDESEGEAAKWQPAMYPVELLAEGMQLGEHTGDSFDLRHEVRAEPLQLPFILVCCFE